MVRFINKALFGVLLGTAVLAGCKPDNVGPRGSENGPSIGQVAENEHPMMSPVCSDTAYLRLQQTTTGSFNVNYCTNSAGIAITCPANTPEWGSVMMVNGRDSLAAYFTLPLGWYLDASQSEFTLGSNFVLDASGLPTVTNDFISNDVPEQNKWALFIRKENIQKDANNCFSGAMRLTVVKFRGFFGGKDPNSSRVVWATTTGKYGPGDTYFNDASPYLVNWCWKACPPAAPGGPYPITTCDAAPSTPLLDCTPVVGGAGGCGYGNGLGPFNIINLGTVRCVDTSGTLQPFNFSAAGALIIGEGQTVTTSINAFYGGTIIVKGTLNWSGTATYNNAMNIYVEPGGVLNKVGTSTAITLNSPLSVIVNHGTINVPTNMIVKGSFYNLGEVSARNLTVTGPTAKYVNASSGSTIVSLNYSGTLGCTTSNCGRFDITGTLTSDATSTFSNYCTLVARSYIQQNGIFNNSGVTVAGVSGSGNGFVNNGTTSLNNGSVLISKDFKWGAARTINLRGAAWIIAAESVLGANGNVTGFGNAGRFILGAGSILSGPGELAVLDVNPLVAPDVPSGNGSVAASVVVLGGANVTHRALNRTEDLPHTCWE